MKDKFKGHLNLKYDDISIHFYMYISIYTKLKRSFWHKYKTIKN